MNCHLLTQEHVTKAAPHSATPTASKQMKLLYHTVTTRGSALKHPGARNCPAQPPPPPFLMVSTLTEWHLLLSHVAKALAHLLLANRAPRTELLYLPEARKAPHSASTTTPHHGVCTQERLLCTAQAAMPADSQHVLHD